MCIHGGGSRPGIEPRRWQAAQAVSLARVGRAGRSTPAASGLTPSRDRDPGCLVSMDGAAGFEPVTTCAQDSELPISLLSVAPRLGKAISQPPNRIAPKMLFQFG